MICPCGSQTDYEKCCEPVITGKTPAVSAEALLRSRYTAHVKAEISYLRETLAPEKRKEFNDEEARKWATESEWLGLEIKSSESRANRARIDFIATYSAEGKTVRHREIAQFRKESDRWYFVDGRAKLEEVNEAETQPVATIVREGPKVGRNDPCPCGSGKKFKKCCGA